MAFKKVFDADIKNLLTMADMWRHRQPPTPLEYESILAGTFPLKDVQSNGIANGAPAAGAKGTNGVSSSKASLKDQKVLTLVENVKLFMDRSVCVDNFNGQPF